MGKLEVYNLSKKNVKDILKKWYFTIDGYYILPFIWSDEEFFFYIKEKNWYQLTWEWYIWTEKDAKEEFVDLSNRYPWYMKKWIKLIDENWNYVKI
jgi:hypothetical protein